MKGVSLEVMVGLIIAISAAAIIFLMVFGSGLISNFKETVGITITMFSAYTRLFIVNALNLLLTITAIMLMFVAMISLYRYSKGLVKRYIYSGYTQTFAGYNLMPIAKMGLLSLFILIIYITMVNTTFAAIPFFGSTIDVHLGDKNNPYNSTLVADEIANRIDTTWKAMGGNLGNPLEGLTNKPNPYPLFVIFPYPKHVLNMSYVYKRLVNKTGTPDYDIYVFCDKSKGILGSKPVQSNVNPFCWFNHHDCDALSHVNGRMHYDGVCNITNTSKIYIEYADILTGLTAPLASSGIHKDNNCPYMTGVGNLDRDVIAICIK